MTKIVPISETGPFTGVHSALDPGDMPEGSTDDQVNVETVPGNPAAFQVRDGKSLKKREDSVAADPWSTADNFVIYDWVHQSNATYQAIGSITGGGTFASQIANWKSRQSVGVLAGSAAEIESVGPLIIVQHSTGETLLAGMFETKSRAPLTQGYVVPEPVANFAAVELAYGMAFAETGSTVCALIALDVNPASATLLAARLVAKVNTAAGINHRPVVIKGSNNKAVWLARISIKHASDDHYTPADLPVSERSHYGLWDGTNGGGLTYGTANASTADLGDGRRNNFESDDQPHFMFLFPNMEVGIIGSNDRNASSEPYGPMGEKGATDLAWRFPSDGLPSILFYGDAMRCNARYDRDPDDDDDGNQNESAYPIAHGLPNGDFVICTTANSTSHWGIAVRRVNWASPVPTVIESSRHRMTTSLEPAKGSNGSAAAARNTFAPARVSLLDGNTCIVAQGTVGASIVDLTGQARIQLSPGGICGASVCSSKQQKIVLVIEGASSVSLVLYDRHGTALGGSYTTVQYPGLSGLFRGAFFDAQERFLYVVTYDATRTAGVRNVVTIIPMGIAAWVTGVLYTTNSLVLEAGKVYAARSPHMSGTFATDLLNLKWGTGGTTADAQILSFAPDMAALSTLEANLWFGVDAAAAQFRNITMGVPV